MKKPSRFLRMILASGLLISLLAVTIAPAAAQPDPPSSEPPYQFQGVNPGSVGTSGNTIFYPWVSHNEDFGLGESKTSISVQNLENVDGQIWIYRGDADNNWVLAATSNLSAWAAKTFTAQQLGLNATNSPDGGAPIAVVAFTSVTRGAGTPPWGGTATGTFTETGVILSNPKLGAPNIGQAQVFACVANDASGDPSPFIWTADPAILDGHFPGDPGSSWYNDGVNIWVTADWDQTDLQTLLEDAQGNLLDPLVNPFGGLNNDGDCEDAITVRAAGTVVFNGLTIGGTAFATATAGSDEAELEQFTTTHTATSGYNAVNGHEVGHFYEWYLPIVQTNCGPGGCWDSVIRVANFQHNNSAVTLRFFPADDGSGSLQTGFQFTELVQGGETYNVQLSSLVPEGWVGSVHVYSDGYVFAMVDRFKTGTDMWITNTGSSADFERGNGSGPGSQYPGGPSNMWNGWNYALFAPHVLIDYFGWNVGINVANLVNWDNNVNIQYFNHLGNATQGQSKRLAPHGMTYFYDPSDAGQNWSNQNPETDPNAGIVASAIILSDFPVAAVIDATKYTESDPNGGADVGQATSYNATSNAHPWQAVPYVTKGNPTDGSGATSGINFMNINSHAVTVDVEFVNQSGFIAANFGLSSVIVPAYANGFVYTLWQHNVPNGFTGAAVAISRNGPIVVASANVNYDVDGDGAVIYNGFNPCGFYRTTDVSNLTDVWGWDGDDDEWFEFVVWFNSLCGQQSVLQ